MISWASCQRTLALRSKKNERLQKKKQRLNKQKDAGEVFSCALILFCLILHPELTAWQERWECWARGDGGTGRLGRGCSSTWTQNIRANIMANPRDTIRKLQYGCLAADLTLITGDSLYLTASPDGRRQGGHGHMTASLSAVHAARKMAGRMLSAATDCWWGSLSKYKYL